MGAKNQEKTLRGRKKIGQIAIHPDKTKQKNKTNKKSPQEAEFTFLLCPCVIIERQLLATQPRYTERRLGGAHLPSLLISITGEHTAVIKIHTVHTKSAFEMSYCSQGT